VTAETPCPLGLDELLGYLLGDLEDRADDELDAIEDHLFDCAACGRRLESLDALRRAVAEAAQNAELGGNVNRAFLERAARDGLSVREYRIDEGTTVACTAGPEDLVLVRLAAGTAHAARGEEIDPLELRVTFEDLERGESTDLPPREVALDHDMGEVMLVFPGDTVRAYPRSRWTLHLGGHTYVMDHTPAPGSLDS